MERIDNLKDELEKEPTTVSEEAETNEVKEEEVVEKAEDGAEVITTEVKEEDIPEKFRGKSTGDIIKSYQELEKLVGQRALSQDERSGLKDAGLERKDLEKMEDLKQLIDGTDFTKMSPAQFAEFIVGLTDKRADTRAKEIYDNASTVKEAVQTEIGEATTKFPLLKSNKEFRELVLAVIEADAGRGKTTPIVEACTKVSAMIGAREQTDGKEKEQQLKRTPIEGSSVGSTGEKDTEEEQIISGLKGGGVKNSALGGLGI